MTNRAEPIAETPRPQAGDYSFGRTPTVRIDAFAFPRTGSHLFRYCTRGLFDVVAPPAPAARDAEAAARADELDPGALYALDLREDGTPFTPVWIDMAPRGRHADPDITPHPTVILAREPMATVYSLWRVGFGRWGWEPPRDPRAWAARKLERYRRFLDHAHRVLGAKGDGALLLRFEELAADDAAPALARLAAFVGVRPKLSPAFVARATRFSSMVKPGARTFYRAGSNGAWREDEAWQGIVRGLESPSFADFGYGALDG